MARVAKKSVKKTPDVAQVAALKAENDLLKQEIKILTEKRVKKSRQRSFWRSFFAGLAAVIAVVCFMLFNISYWTQKTIIDNKQFTAAVAPIISDADVQVALQKEITKQIFTRINVEQELKTALPDNLQFIAAPFASQVESFTSDKIGDALRSPQVAAAWTTVISTVHSQLLAYIQDPANNGVITVDDVYAKVGDQLKTSQIGFLFGKNLPSSVGTVTLAKVKFLPQARQALDVLQSITNQLALAAIIGAVVALGLSTRRKAMLVGLLSFSLLFMLCTLVAIQIGQWQTGVQVAPAYSAAAISVYSIVTDSLVKQTQGFAALFGAVLAILFIASSLDWVVWLRKQYRKGLDWIFVKLPIHIVSPGWLVWTAANQIVITWTLIAVMFVAFALRIPPTKNGVIGALIGSAIVVIALSGASSFVRVNQKTNS